MVSHKSKRAPAKPDPTDAVTAPIEAPLPSVKDLLEAIQQLNKNQQVMEDNQKKLEQENKQLAGYITQIVRTESAPVAAPPQDPETKAGKILQLAKGVDLNKILEIVGKFLPSPPPTPTTETGMIFNNKEMQELWKDDFKERMALDRAKRNAEVESLTLDNAVKKKRMDGEMFE